MSESKATTKSSVWARYRLARENVQATARSVKASLELLENARRRTRTRREELIAANKLRRRADEFLRITYAQEIKARDEWSWLQEQQKARHEEEGEEKKSTSTCIRLCEQVLRAAHLVPMHVDKYNRCYWLRERAKLRELRLQHELVKAMDEEATRLDAYEQATRAHERAVEEMSILVNTYGKVTLTLRGWLCRLRLAGAAAADGIRLSSVKQLSSLPIHHDKDDDDRLYPLPSAPPLPTGSD